MSKIENSEISESSLLLQTLAEVVTKNELSQKLKDYLVATKLFLSQSSPCVMYLYFYSKEKSCFILTICRFLRFS